MTDAGSWMDMDGKFYLPFYTTREDGPSGLDVKESW